MKLLLRTRTIRTSIYTPWAWFGFFGLGLGGDHTAEVCEIAALGLFAFPSFFVRISFSLLKLTLSCVRVCARGMGHGALCNRCSVVAAHMKSESERLSRPVLGSIEFL